MAKEGSSSLEFTSSDIKIFDNWKFNEPGFWVGEKPNHQAPFELISLTSTVEGTLQKHHPSSINVGGKLFQIQNGVSLLWKSERNFTLSNFNLKDSIAQQEMIQLLSKLNRSKQYFMLLTRGFNDEVSQELQLSLRSLGFEKLAAHNGSKAYLAYAYEGFVNEYQQDFTISVTLPKQIEVRRSRSQIYQDARNRNKFIAHAGGIIDGHTYTNSLEALNRSYEKGFRLFEIDILRTSDKQFVAVHNWNEWAQKTGYRGALPPSREIFMQQQLHGKYTPMDMDALNAWFEEHRDAILVSDKVNEPTAFAEQFIDKRRLMMELFTLDALKEGLELGIKSAMPSMHIVNAMEGDKLDQLRSLEVKHMTFSIYNLKDNYDLLKAAKRSGIKTYIYNLNYNLGKNEAYMLCNELDLVYGMYADDWDFRR